VGGFVGFAATADEGERVTVGGESEGAGRATVEDQLVDGCGFGGVGDPDLAVVDEEEGAAVGREEWRVSFSDEDGLGIGGEWLDEDFEWGGALEVGRIRWLAVGTGFGAVGVGDHGDIGRPRELGNILRVILGVVGELPRDLIRPGDPKIVAALHIFYPSEEVAMWCGCEGRGVGCAKDLLQRKGLSVRCVLCGRSQ
jgi:hypothetical protein